MAAAELQQLFSGSFAAAEACLSARAGCTVMGKTAEQTAAAGEATSLPKSLQQKPDKLVLLGARGLGCSVQGQTRASCAPHNIIPVADQ